MTTQPSPADDRFSAYLDGELTEGEARAFERELEESPSARHLLQEYTTLRSLIREVPREQLPENLADEVMQRLRTLPARPTSSRRWIWRVALPLVTTAACVLLLVKINPPRFDQMGDQKSVGESKTAPVLAAEPTLKSDLNSTLPGSNEGEVASTPSSPSLGNSSDTQFHGGVMSVNNALAPTAGHPVPADVELGVHSTFPSSGDGGGDEAEKIVSSDGSRLLMVTGEELASLQVGETVRALQQSGDEVSVVKLLVVDRDRALNSLQLILSSQKVSAEGQEEISTAEKPSRDTGRVQDKPANDDVSLMAVYVQASESQLAATLEEMKREHEQFLELAVDESLVSSGVTEVLKKQAPIDDSAQDSKIANEKEDLPKSSASAPSARKVADRDAFSTLPTAPVEAENRERLARQQVIEVSPTLIDSLTRQNSSMSRQKQAGVREEAGQRSDKLKAAETPRPVSPSLTAQSTKDPNAEQDQVKKESHRDESKRQSSAVANSPGVPSSEAPRQMQVLFVLKQRPQPLLKARIPSHAGEIPGATPSSGAKSSQK